MTCEVNQGSKASSPEGGGRQADEEVGLQKSSDRHRWNSHPIEPTHKISRDHTRLAPFLRQTCRDDSKEGVQVGDRS